MSKRHHSTSQPNSYHIPSVSDAINPSNLPENVRVYQVVFTHLLVLTVPLFFTWFNEELFEFNKMILVYAFTAIIAGFWATRMILQKRILWRPSLFDIPIWLFLLSQVASTILSIHPRTSLLGYYTRFHGGLYSSIAYATLFFSIRNGLKKKDVIPLLTSTVLAAGLVAAYAIPEHFGFSPSCWLISGGEQFGVSCWIQDVKSRVFATFGQPNWLAAYMVMTMPIAGFLVLRSQIRWRQLGFGVGLAALGATLVFTQSRSGFLGLIVGVASLLVLSLAYQLLDLVTANQNITLKQLLISGQKTIAGLKSRAAGIVLIAGFLPISIWGSPFFPGLPSLITIPFQTNKTAVNQDASPPLVENPNVPVVNRLEVGGTDSGTIRKIVWEGAFNVWRRYKWFGSGVETFAYSYYLDRPVAHNLVSEWDFLYNKAHNEFLQFLATTGIVGLASYLVMLCAFILGSWWLARKQDPSLGLAFSSAMIALSVSNFFGFSTVMVTVLLFCFPALIAVYTDETNFDFDDKLPLLTATSWVGLAVIWIAVLLWENQVGTWWLADYEYATGKAYVNSGYVQEGVQLLVSAINRSPKEALYYDELGLTYAALAVELQKAQETTKSAELAQAALQAAQTTLTLNDQHLNFYKSTAQVLITLSQIEPDLLTQAAQILSAAIEKAPTDPKLRYNLALVEDNRGKHSNAIDQLKTAVTLKPNYETAKAELGSLLEEDQKWDEALALYHEIVAANPTNQPIIDRITALEATISAKQPKP